MDRDPSTCKNSILFDDIYICRLELKPCTRVKKCALRALEDMAREADRHMRETYPGWGAAEEEEIVEDEYEED